MSLMSATATVIGVMYAEEGRQCIRPSVLLYAVLRCNMSNSLKRFCRLTSRVLEEVHASPRPPWCITGESWLAGGREFIQTKLEGEWGECMKKTAPKKPNVILY